MYNLLAVYAAVSPASTRGAVTDSLNVDPVAGRFQTIRLPKTHAIVDYALTPVH